MRQAETTLGVKVPTLAGQESPQILKTWQDGPLKDARKQLARKWHPDRHQGEAKVTAEARFKEISEAYEYLRNLKVTFRPRAATPPPPVPQGPPGFETFTPTERLLWEMFGALPIRHAPRAPKAPPKWQGGPSWHMPPQRPIRPVPLPKLASRVVPALPSTSPLPVLPTHTLAVRERGPEPARERAWEPTHLTAPARMLTLPKVAPRGVETIDPYTREYEGRSVIVIGRRRTG